MKIIYLPRAHFEEIYWRLSAYVNTTSTPNECMEDALQYIRKQDVLNLELIDDVEWLGQGYRLIHSIGRYYETGACKSIWVSPCGSKVFYEGVLSYRYIEEFKVIDQMFLDSEDIKLLMKKYELFSKYDVREWLDEHIYNLENKIKTMECLCPQNKNLPNFKGELKMAKLILNKYV